MAMVASPTRRNGGGRPPKKTPAKIQINPNDLIPKGDVMKIMCWGKLAWKTACENGLRKVDQGGCVWVVGESLIAFMKAQAEKQNAK